MYPGLKRDAKNDLKPYSGVLDSYLLVSYCVFSIKSSKYKVFYVKMQMKLNEFIFSMPYYRHSK